MSNVLLQKSMRPLSYTTNVKRIIFVVSWEKTRCYKKYQEEIMDSNDTNENPLIQAKPIQVSWGPSAKTPKLKSPSYRQDKDSRKNIRSHKNFLNAGKQKTFQSLSKNTRCKGDPKISTRIFFLLSRSKSQRPLTNEKLSHLNRNERTKIITTFQMSG